MFGRLLLASLVCILSSSPAAAAQVRLQFSGEIDEFNSYSQSQHADQFYTLDQRKYMSGIERRQGMDPGSAYDFVIEYNTQVVPGGGQPSFDLVSGHVGKHTDFSGFRRFIDFQTAGAYTYLNFVFEKTTGTGGTSPIYAIFSLGDNDGDIITGALPVLADPAQIDVRSVSFEARGGYVSDRYRTFRDSAVLGVIPVVPGGGPGGIPEPATWAMMILGFAFVGVGLRGARRTPLQRNVSAG